MKTLWLMTLVVVEVEFLFFTQLFGIIQCASINFMSVLLSGQNKMVINHLEKLFVTNDAATILSELEVQHPAAKMLVLATQQQEQEVGDGTNFVLVFASSLLEQAEMLLRMVRLLANSL